MLLSAGQTGSTRTRPVKSSAGPAAEGCSPARVICCEAADVLTCGSAAGVRLAFSAAAHRESLRNMCMGFLFQL
jgi:hypothetical protein